MEQGAEDLLGVVDVVVEEEDVVVAVDVAVEVEVVVSLSHIETIMIKRRKWIYFIIRFIPYPFGERLTTNVSIGGGG